MAFAKANAQPVASPTRATVLKINSATQSKDVESALKVASAISVCQISLISLLASIVVLFPPR